MREQNVIATGKISDEDLNKVENALKNKMTDKAQTIWKAFCGELKQEPTDDMREALVTAIREIANELQYYNFNGGVDMIVDAHKLYELSDELGVLKSSQKGG